MATACILLLFLSGSDLADEWKTPDGVISVAIPDPARFVVVNPGPEALVAWKSMDGNLMMVFVEIPNPRNERLELSPMVDGFANQLRKAFKNVKILHSAVEVRAGHEVLSLTGSGEKKELTIYETEVFVSTGGKVYKATVTGAGIDTRTDPDATTFIASFKPLVPGQSRPTALVPAPVGQLVQMPPEPEADVSQKLGFYAGMLLFIVFFVAVVTYLARLIRPRNTDDEDNERPRRRRRRRDDEDDEERPRRRRRREEEEDD